MGKYRINSCLVLIIVGVLVLGVLTYLAVVKGAEFLRLCADMLGPRVDENGEATHSGVSRTVEGVLVVDVQTPGNAQEAA